MLSLANKIELHPSIHKRIILPHKTKYEIIYLLLGHNLSSRTTKIRLTPRHAPLYNDNHPSDYFSLILREKSDTHGQRVS